MREGARRLGLLLTRLPPLLLHLLLSLLGLLRLLHLRVLSMLLHLLLGLLRLVDQTLCNSPHVHVWGS